MKRIEIRQNGNNALLFAGAYASLRRCAEAAIEAGISLAHANFSGGNLVNAMMDGADLQYACLQNTNLSGANLSECCLDGADLRGATLYGATLCGSSLVKCRLEGVSFGGTDIAGAIIDHCRISTLSAFSLEFNLCESMKNVHFLNPCGTLCTMNRPPVVIQGLRAPLILMDRFLKAGNKIYALPELPLFSYDFRMQLESIAEVWSKKC